MNFFKKKCLIKFIANKNNNNNNGRLNSIYLFIYF